ncbi:hypothetical protein ACF0H5_009745 [Mactra antiquata]
MKSPKKNLKARSAVTSRKTSPGWTSATDLFKSTKSPSPVRRVTRRSSMYVKKAGDSNFKMPLSKIVSPPGVKTRSRRSSIYQKSGGVAMGTLRTSNRRTSMYVSSKNMAENVDVFSKVWSTPVRQPAPIAELSPEKPRPKSNKKSAEPKIETKPAAKTPTAGKSTGKKDNGSVLRSTKKSPQQSSKKRLNLEKSTTMITSTPSKSIPTNSFYSTPTETPIVNERTDEVFVFSAMPVKSAKKSTKAKKSVVLTPVDTPDRSKKTPKRMPTRKTPAVKRSRQNESLSTMDSPLVISPIANRLRASVKRPAIRSTKIEVDNTKPFKSHLSPVEMTSVLKSAVEGNKRGPTSSPSPRPTKRARKDPELIDETTPKLTKAMKRSSPKKLTEMDTSIIENTSNNHSINEEPANATLLNFNETFNETINTDSRSSRCIIL